MQYKKSHVVDLKEQEAIATVARELISNCKIDYYPEEGRTYVYFHGPRRFNLIQQDINAVKIKIEQYN